MSKEIDTEEIISELATIVGATHISSAPADVKAYGGLEPFVVVWPGSPPEVARVLKACHDEDVVVGIGGPGGKATRHWPVTGERPRVAMDTSRMTNILDLDELALTVHCQCGIQVGHLEDALRRHKLTIGPYPSEIHDSSLGGLLSAPNPHAYSPRTGWFKDAALAVTVASPDGTLIHSRVAPRKATGPDLSRFFIGSRAAFGVITTTTLRVHRLPEAELATGFVLPDVAAALALAREALVVGVRPARLRVLGHARAADELGEPGEAAGAAVLTVLEGPRALVTVEHQQLRGLARDLGGEELSSSLADRWRARRATPGQAPRSISAGSRLPHSRLAEVVEAIPSAIKGFPVLVWAEEVSLQGATLWLECKGLSDAENTLRSVLLNAGADPVRFDFPPLMGELTQALDPAGTMVVMEGEWSDS